MLVTKAGFGSTAAFTGETIIQGKYGSLKLNANGEYTYTLNPLLQSREAAGDSTVNLYWDIQRQNTETSIKEVFNVEVDSRNSKGDSLGTGTGTITISLNGTNDAPILRTYEYTSTGNVVTVNADGIITTASETLQKDHGSFTETGKDGILYDGTGILAEVRKGSNWQDARVTGKIRSSDIDDPDGTPDATEPSVLTYGIRVVYVANAGSSGEGKYELVYKGADGKEYYGNDVAVVSSTKVEVLQSWDGDYGTLFIKPDGTYTYVVNSLNDKIEALDDTTAQLNETFGGKFSISVMDGRGGVDSCGINIVIHGNGDPSTGGGTLPAADLVAGVGNVVEDGGKCDTPDHAIVPNPHPVYDEALKSCKGSVAADMAWQSNPFIRFYLEAGGKSVQSIVGEYGTMTIDVRKGTFEFTLHETGVVQTLKEGEVKTLTFNVKVDGQTNDAHTVNGTPCTSGDSHSDTTTITITLTGTNDAPKITSVTDLMVTALDNAADDAVIMQSGTVVGTDVDLAANKVITYSLSTSAASGTSSSWWVFWDSTTDASNPKLALTATDPGMNSWGKFVLNVNGSYEFILNNNNAAIKAMGKGEFHSIDIPVYALDEYNAVGESKITVTITGSNAVPVINSSATFSVYEDATGIGLDVANMEVAFNKTFSDGTNTGTGVGTPIDVDDTSFTFMAFKGSSPAGKGGTSIQGDYGILLLDSTTGTYTYKLDNAKAQKLGEGEIVDETFTIFAKDSQGDSSNAYTVTAKVVGKNDVPVLTVGTLLKVTEGAGDSVASATFKATVVDIDANDSHEFGFKCAGETAVVQKAYAVKGADGTFTVVSSAPSNGEYYGTFKIDKSSGDYTFTVNNDALCVKQLTDGDLRKFTVDVQVDDLKGGTAIREVEAHLIGTNNAPEITLPGTDGVVAFSEDATIPTMQVSATDQEAQKPESAEKITFQFVGANNNPTNSIVDANLGTLHIDSATGLITLSASNYQHLGKYDANDSSTFITTTVKVRATDSYAKYTEKELTVRVEGENDAPVLTLSKNTLPWTETDDGKSFGKATASDVDLTDADKLVYGVSVGTGTAVYDDDKDGETVSGTYGDLTINTDGSYSYVLTKSAGAGATDTFALWVKDAHSASDSETVTISFTEASEPIVSAPPLSPAPPVPSTPPVTDLLGTEGDDLLVWTGDTAVSDGKAGIDMVALTGDLFSTDQDLLTLIASSKVSNVEMFLGSKTAITDLTSLSAWADANDITIDQAGGAVTIGTTGKWIEGTSTVANFNLYTSDNGTTDNTDDMTLYVKQAEILAG